MLTTMNMMKNVNNFCDDAMNDRCVQSVFPPPSPLFSCSCICFERGRAVRVFKIEFLSFSPECDKFALVSICLNVWGCASAHAWEADVVFFC